jgi:tetratricopeptide (TPR) repeat protein
MIRFGISPVMTARVFISATSKDLGTVREEVKEALLTMECLPVEQSNFQPDYRSVQEMIEHKIGLCDAVIHVVGQRYGAEPDPASLPENTPRRSYTQMEADVAGQLGKKLYLFVCTEDFPYDQAPPEKEELQVLQRAYRDEISKSKTLRTKVTNREELGRKVREIQLKEEVGYDRNRAREQLVADIKAQAQKQIAEAADDWRKAMEIEKWRDQQLADLDRFLDRITQTFQSGEATESYRKATELLTSKGIDEALAYLEARANQRRSLIETQARRRDQEEAELRKVLREELLAASLLEKKFQFKDAETKYREVVSTDPGWAEARNAFAWFLIQRGETISPELANKKLREAQELCRGTLALTSRETAPQDWAMTQNNLGLVLWDLGGRSSGEESGKYLEQAVAAYRAALEVYTREQLPQDWATTQNNLGNVLGNLGERSRGEESGKYLEQTVAAYRAALEVRTREQLPQDWATTQNNLGIVLKVLGERSSGTEGIRHFQESLEAFENALTVLTPKYYPALNEIVQSNLEESKQLLRQASH